MTAHRLTRVTALVLVGLVARRAGLLPLLVDRVGRLPHPGHGDAPLVRDLNGVLAWATPVQSAPEVAIAD